MSTLNTHVHVQNPDGLFQSFGPGDELPQWALRKLGAHCFTDGVHPLGDWETAETTERAVRVHADAVDLHERVTTIMTAKRAVPPPPVRAARKVTRRTG